MGPFEKEVFQNYVPNEAKLLSYGFIKLNGMFCLSHDIRGGEFTLEIKIIGNEVSTKLQENADGEEYVLYKINHSVGDFAGKIRNEISNILLDIKNKCFDKPTFENPLALEIISYLHHNYNEGLEYLWADSDNAIIRRSDNKKWYVIFMLLPLKKLSISSNDIEPIIVIRGCGKDIDYRNVFPGFHMNKKSWISLVLDGRVDLASTISLVETSRLLATKSTKKK